MHTERLRFEAHKNRNANRDCSAVLKPEHLKIDSSLANASPISAPKMWAQLEHTLELSRLEFVGLFNHLEDVYDIIEAISRMDFYCQSRPYLVTDPDLY